MFSEAFSPSAGPENRMAGACKHGVMLPLCMCQRERAPFVVWREGDKAEAGPDYHGPKVKLSSGGATTRASQGGRPRSL